MTGIFDGFATALNGLFGDQINVTPSVGDSYDIDAVFREEPIEVLNEYQHAVLTTGPTLQVPKPLQTNIQRGDEIRPGNGKFYVIENSTPNGSPASDAFVIFELLEDGG